ncbi:MAG: DUF167 domain-containing protein [Patescibacteria group bacterium]
MKVLVIVHPNAKRPRVEKDMLGDLHVYVNQPPLEGRANRAVVESLAEFFKIRKNKIILVSGVKSKRKLFDIIN